MTAYLTKSLVNAETVANGTMAIASSSKSSGKINLLGAITKPLTKKIVQVSK